eukprot:1275215-Pleurochrysis_carterae.AAC.1
MVLRYLWAYAAQRRRAVRARKAQRQRMLSSTGGSDGLNAMLRERARKEACKQARLNSSCQSSCEANRSGLELTPAQSSSQSQAFEQLPTQKQRAGI